MEPQSGERPIREEEARYWAIQLANQNPHLDGMLVAAQLAGKSWAEILRMLREATTSPE
jgi:hypothetical protein